MKKSVTALLFLVTLICMSSTTVANEPENLLLNPGFEFGEEGVAYNWTHDTTKTKRLEDKSSIGGWSMWMGDVTTDYDGREILSHPVDVSPQEEYVFSAWYNIQNSENQKPEDYTHSTRIRWLDDDKNEIDEDPYRGDDFDVFNEWSDVRYMAVSPKNASYAQLRIRAKRDDGSFGKTDVYWDNASIRIIKEEEGDVKKHILELSVSGEGSINPPPGVYHHESGREVELEAEPDEGWKFDGWSGDVDRSGITIEVAMDENKSINANFEEEGDEEEERIDVNEAEKEELEEIVNIGPTIAEKISEDCNDFYALTQLTDVKGLGKSTVREIIEEGVAYVLPPENEEWKLSQNVCNGEDEGEENGMFIKDAPEEFEGQELEMEEIKEEVCPDKKVIEPEDEEEDEERFVLFDYDRKVYVGGTIESTVLVRNHNNYSEFRLYSYLYREHECLNQGCWTGNERNVEVKTDEKKIIHLKNKVKDDVEPGIYDFTVRIRNETDLEGSVEVTERESMEERKSKEVNRTETPTGKTYKKRGPLESIIHSLLSLF